MSGRDVDEFEAVALPQPASGADLLRPLIGGLSAHLSRTSSGAVIGELIAMKDDGRTPLVRFPRQPGSAAAS